MHIDTCEIVRRLQSMAKARDIEILFACIAGSHAYGTQTEASDVDVRFIYRHPLPWYLTIERKDDFIEYTEGTTDEVKYDFVGWEIRKTLGLLRKSNPQLFEWFNSPTILINKIDDIALSAPCYWNQYAACQHYLQFARNTYFDAIEEGDVKNKALVNAVRLILACDFIMRHDEIPPVQLELLVDPLPTELRSQLRYSYKNKHEKTSVTHSPLCVWMLDQITEKSILAKEITRKAKLDPEPLNKILQRLVYQCCT